ncbi:DUF3846 domain-containing protein [Streptomyces lividans]|uniref:DUF3846 domain-containing protein n=2 Tax=Streptomyces lividans TaxID=1916 RepID=Q848F7_STRLI|nr:MULTISPECIES: hypothetical protein [Streptomyces]AAO61157.1 hypothetical protein [Streptomyces lividans 1326]ABD72327.1 pQC542.23 [Streptomyces lividans]KKD11009.1 hypothetical protein TR66_33430 [Streptomyces sp. WM6391]
MSARFALVIHSTRSFEVIEFAGHSSASLSALYDKVDSPNITVVDLSPELSVWLDEDGYGDHNAPATAVRTAIAAASGDPDEDQGQDHYGTAVFTGIDSQDDTSGLTLDTCHALLKLAGIDVPPIPGARIR